MDVNLSLVLSPVCGMLFGFVGSFLFLGASFALVRKPHWWRAGYPAAGAVAGLVHSALGYALNIASKQLAPGGTWESIIGGVGLIGGFLLASVRPELAYATFVAAPFGGVMAGWLYANMRT